ncbi:predicted protein [Botrytis cinerea T4]|uniref:Uncharacterized protein n=1 Tax=Botryotinia fuckeliana (strain T4) TaxID=999810 RepID=G2YU32_BOTF4|nr:predicted protein [Botrytis cinerea T4]
MKGSVPNFLDDSQGLAYVNNKLRRIILRSQCKREKKAVTKKEKKKDVRNYSKFVWLE